MINIIYFKIVRNIFKVIDSKIKMLTLKLLSHFGMFLKFIYLYFNILLKNEKFNLVYLMSNYIYR